MNYLEAPGAFIDAANFMIYYFNEPRIKANIRFLYDGERYLAYYNEAKELIGPLPNELYPFCYSDRKRNGFITNAVYKQNFQEMSLESLRDYIKHSCFFSYYFEYWFSDFTKDIPQTREEGVNLNCFEWIEKLDVPEELRYQILKVLSDIEKYQNLLYDTLLAVYEKIKVLRKQHKDVLNAMIHLLNQPQSMKHIMTITLIDISDYDYTVILCNPILMMRKTNEKWICFGINTFDIIQKEKNVSPEFFALIFNDAVKRSIIQLLMKNEELSRNQIIQNYHLTPSIVVKHIEVLGEAGILQLSRYDNGDCVFKLNRDYFKMLSEKIDKSFPYPQTQEK